MAKVNQPGVWGVDVGQCALKALRLEVIDDQVTATAFDYVEHPKILSQPDADADQLTREALDKFLSRNTLKGDVVAISVPGQGGLARFVKLPPVEEKKISDIVRFEAKQQIPFRLEEVVWDYQKIGSGTVTDGFAMETEIGLFAMKRDMVNRYLQHFKDVSVEVNIVQLAPLALCNFVSYDLLHQAAGADGEGEGEAAGKKRCVVALDIGADNSNLVITDADRIIWQRPIPLGGNHFTRALTKDFKLTFAKAEHLKRNAMKSPDLKKILASLKPVLNDFVGEVQRSLGYFTNTHRDAHVEYMVGLGNAFRLPGLQKFLSEKLQLEVRKLQKLQRLTGDGVLTAPQFTENVLSFAVAYGLSLQGLNLARLHTNLLPQEIQLERLVRAKKPWAAAAAAALLLGVGGLTAGLAWANSKYANDDVNKALETSKKSVDTAQGFISKCTDIQNSIDKKVKDTFQMASGQAEQLNWSLLLQYINEALPRANGEKVPPKFWTDRTREAYRLLARGVRAGEELQQDLTQVNIEAILPLYSDDLTPYFERLLKDKKDLEGMPDAERAIVRAKDQAKLPKSGWVVELRGYTYFAPLGKSEGGKLLRGDPNQFLVDSLCRNLSFPAHPFEDELTRDEKKLWQEMLLSIPKAPFDQVQLTAEEKKAAEALQAKEKEKENKEATETKKPKKLTAAQQQVLEKRKLWERKRDIIWNNVSFVVLYRYGLVDNPVPGNFEFIKTSFLKAVLEGADSGKGGAERGGPGFGKGVARGGAEREGAKAGGDARDGGGSDKPAGPDRSGWTPLGDLAQQGFGGGGGGVGPAAGKAPAGDDRRGGGVAPPRDQAQANKPKPKGDFQRAEFVVFFVWKEPTPSEKDAENAATPATPEAAPPIK